MGMIRVTKWVIDHIEGSMWALSRKLPLKFFRYKHSYADLSFGDVREGEPQNMLKLSCNTGVRPHQLKGQ